jgi:hypothetical protein
LQPIGWNCPRRQSPIHHFCWALYMCRQDWYYGVSTLKG